ncbi:MAG: serine acetyltransferase [Deltaproteobacteria bacterium]|jgi:serine O-acetyltransferase|nr:serine acetyltransferase [Deltaproteobacteria bacterium]
MKESPEKPRSLARTRMPELERVVETLCDPESYESVIHHSLHGASMPSLKDLEELMSRLKAAIFPGFYGTSSVRIDSMRYHMAANLDSIYRNLAEQIRRGGCFTCAEFATDCAICGETSNDMALKFMATLPRIRELLAGDVRAAYEGDPAAKTPGETIFCYPSITALTHQRIAHELYSLGVPLIPRIITEMAHSVTGIDIHPGASIGEECFIDHGTGVVIGETCVIGNRCRLYQGVTLGALSFPKEENGALVKGVARHPILENRVTVYAGATILGRVVIGSGSVIGGNLWVTRDVPPESRLVQQQYAYNGT